MNKKQLIVLWSGLFLVVLMGLFPPWIYALPNLSGGMTGVEADAGYSPLWSPPELFSSSTKGTDYEFFVSSLSVIGHIDINRLFVEWVIVGVITAGIIVSIKRQKVK